MYVLLFLEVFSFSLMHFNLKIFTHVFLGTNAIYFHHQPKETVQDIRHRGLQTQAPAQVTIPNLKAKAPLRVTVPNHRRVVTAARTKRKSQSLGTQRPSVKRRIKHTSLSKALFTRDILAHNIAIKR